ncbi:MAG: type IV toxin-antitoxin system AbiEi family antitoxin domain-containing protein [Nitrospirota bacterium]
MGTEKIIHTGIGLELIRRLAAEGYRIFTSRQAREFAPAVGMSADYVRQSLHYMARAGWIVRLHKGLYALSSAVPGVVPAHEFEIAMALVEPAAISHWSALHHHGLTEQVPRRVFVLTTTETSIPRVRGEKAKEVQNGYPVAGITYQFIRVKPERFFGAEKVWVNEARVMVTDPERTLLDGLSMPRYCGDFAEVLHAFEIRGAALDLDRIIKYALRLDAAVAKRLGWVLEQRGIEPSKLEPLAALRTKGYRTLDASGPRKGPYNHRWMVQENLPGKVA